MTAAPCNSEKLGGDFAKFCGLLRKYDLYKGKTRSLKRPCYYYVPNKYVDIPEALFENVRFMKQIVSLFFMKAFYLEVLQKILTRNLIIFFTFLDSYYIKIYYQMQTHK